jgi:hypothetical protein
MMEQTCSLESRMRENRPSGLVGGAGCCSPAPTSISAGSAGRAASGLERMGSEAVVETGERRPKTGKGSSETGENVEEAES